MEEWGEPYEQLFKLRDGISESNSGKSEIMWHGEFVTRCKDCKHYERARQYIPGKGMSDWHICYRSAIEPDDFPAEVEPDGFCKWGEPR